MEERKHRKSITSLNKLPLFWLWIPVIISILLTIIFCILDFGSPITVFVVIIFYNFVAAPILSVLYCKMVRNLGSAKYLCCIYNAFMMGTYFMVAAIFGNISVGRIESLADLFRFIEANSLSPYFLSLFFPALICGLITLKYYDAKDSKTKDTFLF